MISGASTFPAACCGVASNQDKQTTLRIEDFLQLAAVSFNERYSMPGVNTFDKNVDQYEQWFVDNPLAYVSELRAVRELLPAKERDRGRIGTAGSPHRWASPRDRAFAVHGRAGEEKEIEVIHGVAEHLPFMTASSTSCSWSPQSASSTTWKWHSVRPIGSQAGRFVRDRLRGPGQPFGKGIPHEKDKSEFYQHATFYSADDIVTHIQLTGCGKLAFRQTSSAAVGDGRGRAGEGRHGKGRSWWCGERRNSGQSMKTTA